MPRRPTTAVYIRGRNISSDMARVLIAPADTRLSNLRYGKSYNVLNNMTADDVTIDALVGEEETAVEAQNVTVRELGTQNRLQYYGRSFRTAAREIRAGSVDIYHHMNLSYRWFNPVLLAGIAADTPTVLGPCQTGHAIMAEEFNNMLSQAIGYELPLPVSNAVYYPMNAVRDVTIDPVRMSLFRRTLEAADRITVVHEEAREAYARHVDESKIDVIPLGVDAELFEFTERQDTQTLVAIGRLEQRKGYDVLLDALANVVEAFPNVHLDVFGEGPEEQALREQAASLGVADNVTFHGYVDQSVVRDHLARARAFVHPSRSESFSLVRLEAMAVGCPVVVTDTSGAHEMVRDGKEGFVVPTEAAEPIADALLELLSDFELTRAMGARARERVERKYDWRAIGQQYVDLYRSLL
ncbi:Glycosyltransferase [Halomicrobium sp. LC1Hm]|nr:Glycosyltransferase [Halomicrobium sp. LC1Hm]